MVIPTMYNPRFYALCRGCRIETPTAASREEALKLWNDGVFEQG